MNDVFIKLLFLLPILFCGVWIFGWSAGYRNAKVEKRKDKAIDSLLAQNGKLVKANETIRLLLKPLVESKITDLASAHGTEWGDDPQFDALYNLIDSLQFKYRQLISETPKCSA